MTEPNIIKDLREKKNLSQEQLALELGISREMVNKMENNKLGVSAKTKLLILDKYEIDYVNKVSHETKNTKEPTTPYNGESHTANHDQDKNSNQNLYNKIMKKFETFQPIPVYDVDIAASNLELYDDKSAVPEDFYYIPEFSGCRAFNVYSDSMEPLIPKGSRIFAKKIDDWQMVLEYGQVYAVGLIDGRRFIKYIKKADDKQFFKLVSENDFYDDFDVPKDKIRSVWLIDGWMNKHTQSTFFVLKEKG